MTPGYHGTRRVAHRPGPYTKQPHPVSPSPSHSVSGSIPGSYASYASSTNYTSPGPSNFSSGATSTTADVSFHNTAAMAGLALGSLGTAGLHGFSNVESTSSPENTQSHPQFFTTPISSPDAVYTMNPVGRTKSGLSITYEDEEQKTFRTPDEDRMTTVRFRGVSFGGDSSSSSSSNNVSEVHGEGYTALKFVYCVVSVFLSIWNNVWQ